jgi:hypothetical protein
MTALQPEGMESTQQRAAAHLANGEWRSALAEYGALVKADPTDQVAGIGIAQALARGGHIAESYLVLDRVLNPYSYGEGERRNVHDMVRAEAGPAHPDVHVGDVAATTGLLVWRHSKWLGAYLALMLVLSVLPLVVGLTQRHYVSIVFGALTGGALIYLYIARHRVPVWRSLGPERPTSAH